MPCPSCTLLLLVLLAPFLGRQLQQLYLVKALCAACPACSPQQQAWLSWHTSGPSGATQPDADFFSIHEINIIWIIVSIQANQSLEGSLNQANQQGTVFACHILKIYSGTSQRQPLLIRVCGVCGCAYAVCARVACVCARMRVTREG